MRAQGPLTLRFRTIPDPDGWAESLRLKGDWLIFEIDDGALSGFGEASHSNDDERCKQAAAQLFEQHYRGFTLSLESLARKEAEIAALSPDFVTATAFSGLNQALYDLLAKREQVPVWRLFRDATPLDGPAALHDDQSRAADAQRGRVLDDRRRSASARLQDVQVRAVRGRERAGARRRESRGRPRDARAAARAVPRSQAARRLPRAIQPSDFFAIVPQLERLALDWIEEPFAVGPEYDELRKRTRLRISGGELFWGRRRFEEITEQGWCDVIMPDVKHVGGFGPLLDVLKMGAGRIEISPHNPSGPISTAASLHAAAVHPELVRSLEYSFQRQPTRQATGEVIEAACSCSATSPAGASAPQ